MDPATSTRTVRFAERALDFADARCAEQRFERVLRNDVADLRVAELGRPVPAGSSGNVALIACASK